MSTETNVTASIPWVDLERSTPLADIDSVDQLASMSHGIALDIIRIHPDDLDLIGRADNTAKQWSQPINSDLLLSAVTQMKVVVTADQPRGQVKFAMSDRSFLRIALLGSKIARDTCYILHANESDLIVLRQWVARIIDKGKTQ